MPQKSAWIRFIMAMINYPTGRKRTKHRQIPTKTKKSKYGACKCVVDGIKFDSKKEASRYMELKIMEQAGVIRNLRLQVPYVLINKSKYGREIKYVADFVYYENSDIVIEDCKGFRTPVYRLKKRMIAEKYDIEIKET